MASCIKIGDCYQLHNLSPHHPAPDPVFCLSVLGYCRKMLVKHGGLCERGPAPSVDLNGSYKVKFQGDFTNENLIMNNIYHFSQHISLNPKHWTVIPVFVFVLISCLPHSICLNLKWSFLTILFKYKKLKLHKLLILRLRFEYDRESKRSTIFLPVLFFSFAFVEVFVLDLHFEDLCRDL